MLQLALAAIPETNPLLAPLRQKVYQQSTLLPVADKLVNLHQSQIVAQLAEAIRDRRQVHLLRYYSANSNTVSNRLVEPHGFSDHYTQLTAYEPESDTVKTFKTQRIETVEVLETVQTRPPTEVLTDAFDWQGDPVRISLRLTQMAHRLLIEDHPLTRPDSRPNPTDETFPYAYTGEVRSWVGIGRFVLGLPGQVKIDGPDAFRAYVRGRIREYEP